MDKKKVLFVATVVKTHINVFHLPYLQWFQEQGYETHVAARNDFGDEECIIPYCDVHYDIPFERTPIKWNNIKSYKKLKKIISENNYDIVHCHTPVGGMLTRLAAIRARKKGTKVIYTAHGFHFYKGASLINWSIYYPVEKICSYFTDVLITINQEDYHIATKKMKAKKIEYVCGVGVDIERSKNIIVDKSTKRTELGIPENAIMLLSVGELSKRKNHQVVIKALAQINNKKIYYVICGQGKLENELNKLCEELNITEQVIFAGFRRDVIEICKVADIFMFPSLQEGLPVALMEAMASGLPCIVSGIRGNLDLIKNNQGGYAIKGQDVNELANKIRQLSSDMQMQLRMRNTNLEKIKEFDIKSVKKQMIHIYEKQYISRE